MISSFYAALLALLIVWLSLRVIKLRQSKNVGFGDGGETELQMAIRAQGNATEYVPISLILLILLELNQADILLVHAGGIAILVGRVLHARGLLTGRLRDRVLGMQITLFAVIGLAMVTIAYFIYRGFRPV
jgi:uncharacterized membrane protein YecN with MAPEG domain